MALVFELVAIGMTVYASTNVGKELLTIKANIY